MLCACASSTAGRDAPTAKPGELTGVVVAAPVCPVEQVGSRCAPRPVDDAAILASAGRRQVAATQTDPLGRFMLRLPRGRYVVIATNPGGHQSRASTTIDVGARSTRVRLTLDSGIR